jgi:ankyrin repeat protein
LLEAGASVEVKDNTGLVPIFTAVEYGGEDAMRLLLEHGADVETTDGTGETPLLWAASHGGKGVARLLLQKGTNVEIKDDSGQTPLLRAAGAWNEETLRALLDHGASIRVRDRYGCTPLLAAVSAVEGEQAWHWIKFRHCTEPVGLQSRLATVRLLLESRGDDDDVEARDVCGRTALSYAASRGFTSVVQKLLERGGAEVDAVDETGSTPLSYAANHWHRGAVQLLIDHGADVNARDNSGRTPLIKAAAGEEFHAGFPPPWLSPADRDPSSSHPASSHPASSHPERPARRGERDHKAVIRMLLEGGADVEMRDNEGRKALSYASRNGQVKVVRLLLESGGADPEAVEETDMTPLWTAGERITLTPLAEERRAMDVEKRGVMAARCDRDSRRRRGRGVEYMW